MRFIRLECPNCHEHIDFYNKEELDTFLKKVKVPCYGMLPQVDLLRDINMYSQSYTLEQQEKTMELMKEIAQRMSDDLQ